MSVSSAAAAAVNPWVRILDALEKKINRHSYDTWLKPIRYSHSEDRVLFMRVPSPDFAQMAEKYADVILEIIDNL
jgi:chromosomal replication initiator protein